MRYAANFNSNYVRPRLGSAKADLINSLGVNWVRPANARCAGLVQARFLVVRGRNDRPAGRAQSGNLGSAVRCAGATMIDPKMLDDLAQRLAQSVPAGLAAVKADVEENFRSILQAGLARLDLVPRQEFDVQAAVLRRSRELLEALEARVAALEKAQK